MTGYIEPAAPRFSVGTAQGREQLTIPAQGSVFAMVFIFVWLGGWTVGGIMAIQAFAAHPNAFLGFWLCGWALGWLWAGLLLAWFLTGSERLRADGYDIEIERHVLGRAFVKRYRGTDVRRLGVHSQQAPLWGRAGSFGGTPFFQAERWGTVAFEYGARSVYLAGGLDHAEARQIVEWLSTRLPRTARDVGHEEKPPGGGFSDATVRTSGQRE